MKKIIYLPLLLLVLFISVNKVSADTYYHMSRSYDYYVEYNDIYNNYSNIVSELIDYYNLNLKSSSPHYIIFYYNSKLVLQPSNSSDFYAYDSQYVSNSSPSSNSYYYDFTTSSFSSGYIRYQSYSIPYSSDVPFTLVGSNSCSATLNNKCANSITIPSYSNLDLDVSYPLFTLEVGDELPTFLSLVNGPTADFTEVNLSDYDYIILSLKNYNQSPFNTTIYSLGSLCFTPVYNYGMTQKNELYSGYQTMGCTEDYTSITPVSIYIIQSDLDNHAVYYIKKSNSSFNIIKIPTSVFDITYITSENSSDPQVVIGGRSYPVIPFNNLADTANKSTDEGYISGQACSLGDVNCEYETGIGLDISDLWSQPLKVLQSVWTSITSVFTLITSFITLIPSPLKEFLISAFMLSIILGLLKIIL